MGLMAMYVWLCVCAGCACDAAFGLTMLFPYLPFMVRDFHLTDDESQLGFYAGFIASSFCIGQFISRYAFFPRRVTYLFMCLCMLILGSCCRVVMRGSFFWGWLSDRIGRKPVILIGLGGSMISFLGFGFSYTFPLAIISRSLGGLLNGTTPCALCWVVSCVCVLRFESRVRWYAWSLNAVG